MIISCPRPTTTVDEGEVATTQVKLDVTRSALWSQKTCMCTQHAGEDQLQPIAATTLKESTPRLAEP
jgi:hypothetical protein